METVISAAEEVISYIALIISMIIELIGITIIIFTVIDGIKNFFIKDEFNFKKMCKDPTFNYGLSSALEVLLAAEILKTISIRSINNLIIVVVLILARLFIEFMLGVERKHKEENEEEKNVSDKKIKTKISTSKNTSSKKGTK